MSNNTRLAILHVFGILAFLSIPVFFSPDFNTQINLFLVDGFRRSFTGYLLLLVFFYVNYYYFIPAYYFPKRTFLYIAFVFFSYCMIAAIPDWLFGHGMTDFPPLQGRPPMPLGNVPPMGNMPPPGNRMPPNGLILFTEGGSILQFLLVTGFSFLLRINNQLGEMHSEKLKAEVSYLKAQINPHFLFNTLNSLYALTISKSDAAPDAVIKLSNMMRYVVSESASEFVPLEKEINYISDYIDMQKLRISETKNLEYAVLGGLQGKLIAPMIIIPFIENAFKYGINSEENWYISILIEVTETEFTLNVTNNKVSISFPENHVSEQGIENTKKRLDYIYPAKHKLIVEDKKETFHVNLKIDLV